VESLEKLVSKDYAKIYGKLSKAYDAVAQAEDCMQSGNYQRAYDILTSALQSLFEIETGNIGKHVGRAEMETAQTNPSSYTPPPIPPDVNECCECAIKLMWNMAGASYHIAVANNAMQGLNVGQINSLAEASSYFTSLKKALAYVIPQLSTANQYLQALNSQPIDIGDYNDAYQIASILADGYTTLNNVVNELNSTVSQSDPNEAIKTIEQLKEQVAKYTNVTYETSGTVSQQVAQAVPSLTQTAQCVCTTLNALQEIEQLEAEAQDMLNNLPQPPQSNSTYANTANYYQSISTIFTRVSSLYSQASAIASQVQSLSSASEQLSQYAQYYTVVGKAYSYLAQAYNELCNTNTTQSFEGLASIYKTANDLVSKAIDCLCNNKIDNNQIEQCVQKLAHCLSDFNHHLYYLYEFYSYMHSHHSELNYIINTLNSYMQNVPFSQSEGYNLVKSGNPRQQIINKYLEPVQSKLNSLVSGMNGDIQQIFMQNYGNKLNCLITALSYYLTAVAYLDSAQCSHSSIPTVVSYLQNAENCFKNAVPYFKNIGGDVSQLCSEIQKLNNQVNLLNNLQNRMNNLQNLMNQINSQYTTPQPAESLTSNLMNLSQKAMNCINCIKNIYAQLGQSVPNCLCDMYNKLNSIYTNAKNEYESLTYQNTNSSNILSDIGNAISDTVENVVANLASIVGTAFNDAMNDLSNFITSHIPGLLGQIIAGVVIGALFVVAQLVPGLDVAVDIAGALSIIASIQDLYLQGVSNPIQIASDLLHALLTPESIAMIVTGILGGIGISRALASRVSPLTTKLATDIEDVGDDAVTDIGAKVDTLIKSVEDSVKDDIKNNTVVQDIKTAFDDIKAKFDNLTTDLTKTDFAKDITTKFDEFDAKFKSVIDKISSTKLAEPKEVKLSTDDLQISPTELKILQLEKEIIPNKELISVKSLDVSEIKDFLTYETGEKEATLIGKINESTGEGEVSSKIIINNKGEIGVTTPESQALVKPPSMTSPGEIITRQANLIRETQGAKVVTANIENGKVIYSEVVQGIGDMIPVLKDDIAKIVTDKYTTLQNLYEEKGVELPDSVSRIILSKLQNLQSEINSLIYTSSDDLNGVLSTLKDVAGKLEGTKFEDEMKDILGKIEGNFGHEQLFTNLIDSIERVKGLLIDAIKSDPKLADSLSGDLDDLDSYLSSLKDLSKNLNDVYKRLGDLANAIKKLSLNTDLLSVMKKLDINDISDLVSDYLDGKVTIDDLISKVYDEAFDKLKLNADNLPSDLGKAFMKVVDDIKNTPNKLDALHDINDLLTKFEKFKDAVTDMENIDPELFMKYLEGNISLFQLLNDVKIYGDDLTSLRQLIKLKGKDAEILDNLYTKLIEKMEEDGEVPLKSRIESLANDEALQKFLVEAFKSDNSEVVSLLEKYLTGDLSKNELVDNLGINIKEGELSAQLKLPSATENSIKVYESLEEEVGKIMEKYLDALEILDEKDPNAIYQIFNDAVDRLAQDNNFDVEDFVKDQIMARLRSYLEDFEDDFRALHLNSLEDFLNGVNVSLDDVIKDIKTLSDFKEVFKDIDEGKIEEAIDKLKGMTYNDVAKDLLEFLTNALNEIKTEKITQIASNLGVDVKSIESYVNSTDVTTLSNVLSEISIKNIPINLEDINISTKLDLLFFIRQVLIKLNKLEIEDSTIISQITTILQKYGILTENVTNLTVAQLISYIDDYIYDSDISVLVNDQFSNIINDVNSIPIRLRRKFKLQIYPINVNSSVSYTSPPSSVSTTIPQVSTQPTPQPPQTTTTISPPTPTPTPPPKNNNNNNNNNSENTPVIINAQNNTSTPVSGKQQKQILII